MITPLPDQFFKYAIVIAVAAVGLAVIDRTNPRLGTIYVIVVLLGVALVQRQGVLAFTSFLQSQTAGLNRPAGG